MLWLKGCPRCDGDLHEERDMYGEYTACLQCGCYLSHLGEVALYYSAQLRVAVRRRHTDRSTVLQLLLPSDNRVCGQRWLNL